MPAFTLAEVAEFVQGRASENPGPTLTGVRPLEFASTHDITYVQSREFLSRLSATAAAAALIPEDFDPIPIPYVKTANPEAAFARLTGVFYPYPRPEAGVSPLASVHPSASVHETASVGPFAVIETGASVGAGTVIGAHSVIGAYSCVGEGSYIFPHVVIYPNVSVGAGVIIHSGTVLGADGFGYARGLDENGAPAALKKYHSGTVEIGADVEIGALSAVDRALAGRTCIEPGVKIDNLVQIAHNVSVGAGTVITSQVGIAGSSTVGKFCVIGGQAGVKDHVHVGDGVALATRVGVYRNVPSGAVMAGSVPAMPHKLFLRVQSLFKRLPELLDRIRKLERLVGVDRKENS